MLDDFIWAGTCTKTELSRKCPNDRPSRVAVAKPQNKPENKPEEKPENCSKASGENE